MNIALFDTNQFKFTQDLIDHWRKKGHTVNKLHTLHMPYVKEADVIWFDCCDASAIMATTKFPEELEGKHVIVRPIDIDVWARYYRRVDWSYVDDLIFIAPHIQKEVLNDVVLDGTFVHLIPCGVDTARFSMRKDPQRNNRVAVVMRLWHGKGMYYLFQAIAMNPNFHFCILGQWGLNQLEMGWFKGYMDQFLADYSNWSHEEHVDDVSAWLEDKAYSVVFSVKEAFSYAAGESAAKGLCTLVHEFLGAKDVWHPRFLWRTMDDLRARLNDPYLYDPQWYRDYVLDTYPLERMLGRIDAIVERGD